MAQVAADSSVQMARVSFVSPTSVSSSGEPQITVPSGINYAVIESGNDYNTIIPPQGNAVIGFQGDSGLSRIDVVEGSELVFVANSDTGNILNQASHVSHRPVNGTVNIAGREYDFDDPYITENFSPAISSLNEHGSYDLYVLTGDSAEGLIRTAGYSIANATRTVPALTTRTTTTQTTPETPDPRGNNQGSEGSGVPEGAIAFGIIAAAFLMGAVLDRYRRRSGSRDAEQDLGGAGRIDNPVFVGFDEAFAARNPVAPGPEDVAPSPYAAGPDELYSPMNTQLRAGPDLGELDQYGYYEVSDDSDAEIGAIEYEPLRSAAAAPAPEPADPQAARLASHNLQAQSSV